MPPFQPLIDQKALQGRHHQLDPLNELKLTVAQRLPDTGYEQFETSIMKQQNKRAA
jgi:hypothetical protein